MPIKTFRQSFFASLFCISSVGCMNKELPVPLKAQGAEMSGTVEMGEDYLLQVFYSLKNNVVVSSNRYTSWDLGFEASASGRHIILNGAKFRMAVYPINKTFGAVNTEDTVGVGSLIDASSGNLDSTAFDDWEGKTYILHRGTDEQGNFLGLLKLQVISVDAKKYTLRFAHVDGTHLHTIELIKDDRYNFVFLSLDEGGKVVNVEPPKSEWDIVFTKYTHFYSELNMRYSVVGCLLNRYQTTAAKDSSSNTFDEIDLISASKLSLSQSVDKVGFEWKSYDINKGKFTVDAQKKYVIRCGAEGRYYKLRFIDFYKSGIKGNPQFEFQRL